MEFVYDFLPETMIGFEDLLHRYEKYKDYFFIILKQFYLCLNDMRRDHISIARSAVVKSKLALLSYGCEAVTCFPEIS